jgi:pyridoxine 5-phosphate synthase
MAQLIVKLNQVTDMRSTRNELYPDPVAAAVLADLAGADGIAVGLYENRQHITEKDINLLRHVVPHNFYLEITPTSNMVELALAAKPDLVTLVPEPSGNKTARSGIDLILRKSDVTEIAQTLHSAKIPVSVLIDPDPDQVKLAHQANADRVELIAEPYCRSVRSKKRTRGRSEIVDAAKIARKLKMTVNAGCGLCYTTIQGFKGVKQIDTYIIGHSIISRAILTGMETAVKEMSKLINEL